MPASARNSARRSEGTTNEPQDDAVEMEEGSNDDDDHQDLSNDADDDVDDMSVEEEEDEEDEELEAEEEEEEAPRTRHSNRDATGNRSNTTQSENRSGGSSRRTSSRTNKFTSSMAEPNSKSIRDLLPQGMSEYVKSETTKKEATRRRRSDTEKEDDDDKEEDAVQTRRAVKVRVSSPHKSPARRHKQRRRSLRHEVAVSEEDDDLSYDASSVADSSEAASVDDEEDEEEEEPLKIQRILASRTETREKWQEICQDMNTSEIDFGSRWFQSTQAKDTSEKEEKKGEEDKGFFEERFLIKWADLGFLHCSWETQEDLMEQIDGAKTYLTTFFRKSHNGLLLSADERCDGDYFDPAYTEVERVLEVQLPEDAGSGKDEPKMDPDLEDSYNESSFGMIMDKKDPNFLEGTGRQFLIKWASLPYSEATYEFERDLILCDIEYKGAVKTFLKRAPKPSKRKREDFLKQGVEEQKRLFKIFGDKSSLEQASREKAVEKYKRELQERVYKNSGQLRDYQGEGVAWMISNFVNQRSCILADEMGLGKTLQTAAFVEILLTKMNRGGPVLVIVPLSTITHWYREFTNWTNLNTIVYHGSSEDRDHIRQLEMAYDADRPQGGVSFNQLFLRKCLPKRSSKAVSPWMFDVLITTPEMIIAEDFAELTAIQWEVLVVDEAHRLKNHSSKLAVSLRDKRFKFEHKLLLTGTPIQNSVEEFWSILNLMDPDKFDDAEEFMELFGDMKSKESVDQLHEEIRPYILRRLKEDVEKSVPEKSETLIEVELTIQQKQWYRALYEKNVKFLHKNKKKALEGPGLNNLAMELRKCCNHLFLLNGVEEEFRREQVKNGLELSEGDFLVKASGKLVLLDKLLPRLKNEGHRVLVFSQFKIMLDILEDYLEARDMKFERIDGSITGNRRQQAIDRFQAPGTEGREPPFIMMLSTRAGGVGINLTAADTCIIFDSDFNPQNDLQAQARCHRIGQTKTVKVYRLLTRKTYEMQMFHMSSLKMGLDQAVLKGFETGSSSEGALSKEEVEKLLRHGAYDIFNEDKAGTAEAESNDFVQQDIDSILERRSRTVVHENTGSNSNAAGGTFSKARFTAAARSPEAAGKGKTRAGTDVDIEDPEFWTKVLGDSATSIDDDELMSKPRQRSRANYSEREYQRQLEAALRLGSDRGSDSESGSESEDQSEENDTGERLRWGGTSPSEWKKEDADVLLKALMTYGYALKPWDKFQASLLLSKEYSNEEFKRMSWSLVLATLLEAAADEVDAAKKRDERAAQKRTEESFEKSPEGGILADLSKQADHPTKDKEEKAKAFEKLLQGMSKWSANVLDDATSFARGHEARDSAVLDKLSGNTSVQKQEATADGVSSKFTESVWPSLKGRGWNAIVCADGESASSTRYTYKEREFATIEATLLHAREQHAELSAMIDTLLSSIESNRRLSLDSIQQERSKLLAMTASNVDMATMSRFIELYAPIQLIVELRKGPSKKLRLSKRLLSTCSLLKTVSDLVAHAKKSLGGPIDMDRLEESIAIDKRTSLPHPLWASHHDAVLIASIAKHGWIDHDKVCRAITDDSSIKWGPPFDSVENVSLDIPPASPDLLATAHRAATFLSGHQTSLANVKGFSTHRVVRTYGVYRVTNDDGQVLHKWMVDEEKLRLSPDATESKSGNELAELPTKKELVKRAKVLLTKGAHASSASETKAPEKSSYGYAVLDQSDRCNVFLAEIMRGVLKTPLSSKFLKTMLSVSLQEIRKRVEGTSPTAAGDEASRSAHGELTRILQQLLTVRQNMSKGTTQCKNVIRVMLGEEPLKPKNNGKDDDLFPKAKMPSLSLSNVTKRAREKGSRPVSRAATGTRTARPTGETAIDSARKKLRDTYSSPQKLASLENSTTSILELTEIETLLLSIICSYGLPPTSNGPSTARKVAAADRNELQGELTWRQLGGRLSVCARAEQEKAAKTLKAARDAMSGGIQGKDNLRALLDLENDFVKKSSVVDQADEYKAEADTLAKKALMLVAKLRQQWGATSVSSFTERSYHGLGTKVLVWFDREVKELAKAHELLDEKGTPLGFTAVDFMYDVPDEDRAKIQISALLDKKGCRQVIGQIAMMTRLHSFVSCWQDYELSNMVKMIAVNMLRSGDLWDHEPHWWRSDNAQCDNDNVLLDLLTKVGLTDELLERFASIGNRVNGSTGRNGRVTRLALQYRANQLVREIHFRLRNVKDRPSTKVVTKKPSTKSLSTSGNVHQTGLVSFFSKAKRSISDMADTLLAGSNADNAVVVDDSDSSAGISKRKALESAPSQSPEKKLRPN